MNEKYRCIHTTLESYNNSRITSADLVTGKEFRRMKRSKDSRLYYTA